MLQRYIAQQRQDGLAWVMPLRGYWLQSGSRTHRGAASSTEPSRPSAALQLLE